MPKQLQQKCFNLRREANPLATWADEEYRAYDAQVSISGEKPIHWRRFHCTRGSSRREGFNLRREANPLATGGIFTIAGPTGSVSISGEKPIHWRPKEP